ncbi:hypothetical protein OK016_26025 [Vibrio chagasii]|nr:hypothetical protein [Vibrio chagasii]
MERPGMVSKGSRIESVQNSPAFSRETDLRGRIKGLGVTNLLMMRGRTLNLITCWKRSVSRAFSMTMPQTPLR